MVSTLSTRTLGDVVSDTWRIYKDNFWKIVAISAIVQIPASIFFAVMISILAGMGIASGLPLTELSGSFIAALVVFFAVLMVGLVLMFIVLEAAVTHAVCQQYVWQPISVKLAFRQTFRRFWPMLGAFIIAFLAVFAMYITIIGIPFAIYFGLRWFFVFQASLLEDASPIEALRGSSELVAGNWWRVLGITIVLWLIISAVTFLPSVILAFIPFIGPAIVNIVLWPAITIGKTVLYSDLRMRAEGAEQFNKDALAKDLGLVPVEEEGWSRFDPA